MAVFRVNKTENYTVMSNQHLRDKNLSLKAKGLLSIMLSLPDDWDYSIEGLTKISIESVCSIRGVLKELEDNDYLVRTRLQNEKGQFEYVYDIYEKPHIEKPYTEKPHTDEPHTENRIQLNTNILNTNKQNTNRFIKPTLEEIQDYITEKKLNVDGRKFFDYFETGNWIDSKGNKVKNWKQKLLTWNSHQKVDNTNKFFDKNEQYSDVVFANEL